MNGLSKISLVERVLDRLFRFQIISGGCEKTGGNGAYLKRWFVRKMPNERKGFQVYIHKILRSDEDSELHDHPWSFVSLILKGGYVEETEDGRLVRYGPGRLLFRDATYRHRLHLAKGLVSWSFILTSPKVRTWYFWRGEERIPWRRFLASKCEGVVDAER